MSKSLSFDMIDKYSQSFNSKPENKLIRNSVIKNGINATAINNDSIIDMNYAFSLEVDTGKVTNQKNSGRCWMFAALNKFRHRMNTKFKMEDFELSQSYTMFWDKLEKANYFLENIIETLDEDVDSRIVCWLLSNPQQDGGQWDMLVSLVEKYGAVPKNVMPETFHSSQSSVMNSLLNQKLREDASILRDLHEKGANIDLVKDAKSDMMSEVYSILCFCLGEPPKKFDFEYRDKDEVFHRDVNLTPKDFFAKYVDIDLKDYVSIINAPTPDKPFNNTYTVKYLGNVVGGKDILYLNVDIETLKNMAVSQLRDKETLRFGCDVGIMSDSASGIMDTNLYDYDLALCTNFGMTKAERLTYRQSCLTHAMVLTGVNIRDDGKTDRWKVENSWGEERGSKGYFIMSDKWLDEYTYQVVINKKYLSTELLKALEQKPIVLKPWDPMGSLALMK